VTPTISVLLPTRGRPSGLHAALTTLLEHAAHPEDLEVLVRGDDDDRASVRPSAAAYFGSASLSFGARLGYARMHDYYNELAARARGRLLFVWNDDTEMLTPRWDEMLLAAATTPLVQFMRVEHKGVADTTFPVVDRRIFEAVGRLANHCYVDTWLDRVSAAAGVQHLRNDIVFRHHRLSDQTAQDNRDAISQEHARWFALDDERAADAAKIKELLERLAKENTP
jgi:hypothetical protein